MADQDVDPEDHGRSEEISDKPSKKSRKSTKDKEYVYVLLNTDIPGTYKIGYHSGDSKSLIQRYITSIPHVQLRLLQESLRARDLEKDLLKALQKYRAINANGRYSEWLTCDFELIRTTLDQIQEENK